jgi:ubiquitin carboxyl-terminal hydrolase 4/11/15
MKDTISSTQPATQPPSEKILNLKSAQVPEGSNGNNVYDFSKEEQLKMANKYLEKQLNIDDKWYLINSDWYTRWIKYINLNSGELNNISPEKINNKSLVELNESTKNYMLKKGLQEESDYFTVPIELWTYLVKCYGLFGVGNLDVIERIVIDDSADLTGLNLRIELTRLSVSLSCRNWKSEQFEKKIVVEEMSRQTKLEEIVEKMRKLFEIPNEKQMRLFLKSEPDDQNETPIDLTKYTTLNNSGYGINDIIVAHVQDNAQVNPPIQVPPPLPVVASASGVTLTPTTFSTQTRQSSRNFEYNSFTNRNNGDYKPGLCGLSNLGNTCFMNSSLQCMSNVPQLTDYFRDNTYKSEINSVNPLGRKGEIAEAYADLINEMWSGQNSYTIPRNFKLNLSRFAPQFTGFQQQDSHELLAFLLDGLHEDLNRIIRKPYVEMGSHVGKTDEQFADESWLDHKKRNDSIIVDYFHGLLKSTLNCLVCKEISIKFDPFCYLSVPLPSKKERLIEFIFVPLDIAKPMTKYKLSIIKNGTIQDLCVALEQATNAGVQRGRLVVCDVYSNKFFKIYEQSEQLSSIRDRDDIYIYELVANLNDQNYFKAKLHLKEKGSYMYSSSCFGLPLFFLLPKQNLTHANIYQHTLQILRRFLKDTSSEEINFKLNNSLNVNDEEEDENSSSSYSSSSKKMITQDEDVDQNNTKSDQQLNGNNNTTIDEEQSGGGGDDDEEARNSQTRSSQRLKNKSIQQNRLLNLFISKNDNIDSENSHMSVSSDDTQLFDYSQATTSVASSFSNHYNTSSSGQQSLSQTANQVISLVADFGSNSSKKIYNKKPYEEFVEHSSCNIQLVKKKDVISISDCFNLYTKTEELSEQDYWHCSKCKSHQASTKKFDLWSLPEVLVVHLKRFSYSRSYRDKIDTQVEFPIKDLDMSSYLINKNPTTPTKYNLIAVSNHYGSLGGGHYTAYGQNRLDGKWYYFDDSSVSGSDENSVCTNAAYLLIYLRQDVYEKTYPNTRTTTASQSEKMDL